MKYTVFVDDNYHHGDESERTRLGDFPDAASAIAACKAIVDGFLEKLDVDCTAEQMHASYRQGGEDPFIVTDDADCRFSAWSYAKERCLALARWR